MSPCRISESQYTLALRDVESFRLLQLAKEVIAAESDTHIQELDLSRTASEYGRRILPCKECFSTAAHGIMIITPVNWYQVSSPLKLMMDRLVCADGGNNDPTSTQGKDAAAVDRYFGYWKPYATNHKELDRDEAVREEVRNAARALLEGVEAQRSGKQIAPSSDLSAQAANKKWPTTSGPSWPAAIGARKKGPSHMDGPVSRQHPRVSTLLDGGTVAAVKGRSRRAQKLSRDTLEE